MKTQILAVCLVLLAITLVASVSDEEFKEYLHKYGKHYDSRREWNHRKSIYEKNKMKSMMKTKKAEQEGKSVRFGINQFTDITEAEFRKTYLNYKRHHLNAPTLRVTEAEVKALPTSWDWRTKGGVTPVKDQGQCGSCWAFSATEGVESAWTLAGNKMVTLSVQQVVSCDTNDDGCGGGDLPTAFQYIQGAGLELDSFYPYSSESGSSGSCLFNASHVVAHISGFQYATQNQSEPAMQVAMVGHTPLSVCVDASNWSDYTSGVMNAAACGTELDHCVQAVGYSSMSNGTAYWIVRNSWNTDWGIDGYIYLELGQNVCGIAEEATYVTI